MTYLWSGMILVGIIYGLLTGNLKAVTEAVVSSSRESVNLCISMAGIVGMWTGLMKIAEGSGLIEGLSGKMGPVLRFLFPGLDPGFHGRQIYFREFPVQYSGAWMAATPAGLKAMESLAEAEEEKRISGIQVAPSGTATDEVCTFLYQYFFAAAYPGKYHCVPCTIWQRKSHSCNRTCHCCHGSKHRSGSDLLRDHEQKGEGRMKLLSYVSELLMPFLILYVVGYGLASRRDIYGDFMEGAKDGLKTAAGICPTLIGLMTAVGILRASGFLDFVGGLLGKLTERMGVPSEILPLTVVRMFSSSAAVSLLLDIFKEYGTDSAAGLMGAVIMSATESVFYCMSVYFAAAKIEKTRYTLPGALIATLAGTVTAIFLVQMMT